MKFAPAVHGSRGDVEPCAAVGLELRRRGHEVRIAVPPNLVSCVESAGGTAVAFGPDIQPLLKEDAYREFWKIQNSIKLLSDGRRLHWRVTKKPEDAQRRELGLPKATASSTRRIAERGSLEIQAYDELCFPGLAPEWAKCDGRRPFVGALTLEMPTDADDEVLSWIAAGTPPIYFGFGSMPVQSPAETVAMISEACTQLGERR
jgi:UDP:flavonoid glycosyltransferase YjiC (YdhE family)